MPTTPTSIHPLARHGTQQRERLLQALIPANLRLDDRSMADLLAFTGQLAQHVRYWPDSNHLTSPETDWQRFWRSDATPLLAGIAATDLTDLRTRYRSVELAFLRAEAAVRTGTADPAAPTPKTLMTQLVRLVREAARLTLDICSQLPPTNPLTGQFSRLVAEKLPNPFRQLIRYDKGVATRTDDLLTDYQPFIGSQPVQQPWGLPTDDDFLAIPFQQPDQTDREPLWRLFLAFYRVLSRMVAAAEQEFQRALQGRTDHPPHIALMLSFLHLFRYLQAETNGLPDKHLRYYYQDVLRLQQRQVIPDRVHLVFGLAQNVDNYRLAKDTAFRGGKDAAGIERIYTLPDEVVLNQARLVEKQSLYFLKKSPVTPLFLAQNVTGLSPKESYLALQDKIKKFTDDKGITPVLSLVSFSDLNPPLDPLSLKAITQWFDAKTALEAKPGLLICSPELWLEKSERRGIAINFPIEVLRSLLDNLNSIQLDFQFSSGTEITTLKNTNLPLLNVEGTRETVSNFQSELEAFISDQSNEPKGQFSRNNDGYELQIILPPSFPAIKPYTGKENPLLAELPYPFLIIQPAEASDYGLFSDSKISNITLQTGSTNIKNLTLQLGDVIYPANAEIPLFGTTTGPTTTFLYVTTPEISLKTIPFTDDSFKINSLPVGNEGISPAPGLTINGTKVFSNRQEREKGKTTDPIFDLPSEPVRFSVTSNRTFLRETITIQAPGNSGPINTYKIAPESISISYLSKVVDFQDQIKKFSEKKLTSPHKLFHLHPGGGITLVDLTDKSFAPVPVYFVPQLTPQVGADPPADPPELADGNLMLGFENLQPDQTLSVLFRTRPGTGDPDKTAPAIVWSYRTNDTWVQLPPSFILTDETDGLGKTGIIRFQIPHDITTNNGHPLGQKSRRDLWWLQASATEIRDKGIEIAALPLLETIVAQAATVQFLPKPANAFDQVEAGLPAKSIAQLDLRDTSIKQIEQPYPSFGGRLPEAQDHLAYYRRISERLRHRQRAVTVWDYEHLTLEAFPGLAVVKCLPHTDKDDLTAPGSVTLALITDPTPLTGNARYYPTLDAGDLADVANWLDRRTDFFVSGQGGFSPCCCHDDDATQPDPAKTDPTPCHCPPQTRLRVVNALFEPVRLQVCVRFRAGLDPVLYRKQLNEALKQFLSPWSGSSAEPIAFGASIQTTELLRFLENLAYVDVILGLKVKHLADRKDNEAPIPWEAADALQPFSSRSVLTTYLEPLNDDNPNVIDHEINLAPGDDPCHCSSCVEDLVKAVIQKFIEEQLKNPPGQFDAAELKKQLDELVNQGNLVGIKPALIASSKTTTGTADSANKDFKGAAYWFDIQIVTNTNTVEFAVAAFAHAPFVKQSVTIPPTA